MQRFKKIISLILTLSLFLTVLPNYFKVSAADTTVTLAFINGSAINVREKASTSSKSLDKISYRQVTVTAKEGDWLKISYTDGGENKSGYIKNVSDWVRLIDYDPKASFEEMLKEFPSTYRSALTELHKKYPNWVFIPEKVGMTFNDAVALQNVEMRKQVMLNTSAHPISWRSMGKGSYDWDKGEWVDNNGSWTGASREIIKYYMDPRNFLNENSVYMFLSQSYGDGNYTEAGLKSFVKGTFLEKGYSDPDNKEGYGGSYIKLILSAGKKSGINPYILASKIIQEQGSKGTSDLISGTYEGANGTLKGYYNFFNWKASGSNTTQVIQNGLKYAKEQKWTNRAKSIVYGAKMYADGYIEIGQDTYYYQDFNVHIPAYVYHQYAQGVHDAYNKGYNLREEYKEKTDSELTFRIPVFESMPTSAYKMPAKSSKLNNYYFSSIKVSGLTPSFYRYTYEYDLKLSGDGVVDIKLPDKATYASAGEFSLKKGTNKVVLKVKSQTGYTNSYTITVKADTACTLYVNGGGNTGSSGNSGNTSSGNNTSSSKPSSGGSSSSSSSSSSKPSSSSVKLGDINGDGKITVSDMATVKLHLLGKYVVPKNKVTAADVNKDGKITVSDMATIKLHLLGKYKIK